MPDAEPTRSLDPAPDGTRTHVPGSRTVSLAGAAGVSPGDVPRMIGRFIVVGEIARGGMGIVYRARDPQLEREVAVKLLAEWLTGRPEAARRFLDEARITGQLQHPSVPPVHETGTIPDGRPFLVMKLIKGRTLDELLKERPDPAFDRGRFLAIFEQICQAVAYAHDRGVIHRDLKPANVMVGNFGEVQVMDWGLAKVLTARPEVGPSPDADDSHATEIHSLRDSDGSFTQAGLLLGTPAYMPPEQAAGAVSQVTERADVFGLGAILCTMLTGKPPYTGLDHEIVRLKAIQGKLAEAHARLDACGAEPDLVALAKRCLAAEPGDRPADAREVARAVASLRTAADDRARQAERDQVAAEARTQEQRKRRQTQAALGIAFTALVVLAGTFAWWQDRQAANRRTEEIRITGEREAERRAVVSRARQAVESATVLADELRDQYRFDQAATALDQAAKLVPEGAPDDLVAALRQARSNLELARALDEVRFSRIRSEPGRDIAGLDDRYRQAFAAQGLDPVADNPEAVAGGIAASPIRSWVLAALGNWARYSREPATRDRLLAVLRVADPGPLADTLREPRHWTDAAALEKLRKEIDLTTTPPHLLTFYLDLWRGAPGGREFVRLAALRYPTDFWVQFEAGWYCIFKEDTADLAVGYLSAALALRPDSPYVLHMLSMALRNRGDTVGAATVCQEAIRRNPHYAPAHTNLGLIRYHSGDRPGALASIEEAIRIEPTRADAHSIRGMILETMGQHDQAHQSYRKAVELRGDVQEYQLRLEAALRQSGDLDGILALYRNTTRSYPQLFWAHLRLGSILMERREFDAAIAEYREAARLNPQSAPLHFELGNAFARAHQVDGALAAWQESLRIDPRHAPALNGMAWIFAAGPNDLRDARKAIAHATKACQITNSRQPHYLDTLAMAYAEAGDFGNAIEYQKQALAIQVFARQHGPEARARLTLYGRNQPHREPGFARTERAPPPRPVR